jgi:hypothetical protein
MGEYHDLTKDTVMPLLSSEHQKYLKNNYHHPDMNGLVDSAHAQTQADPEFRASRDKNDSALRELGRAYDERPNSPEHEAASTAYQAANEASTQVFNKKLAEHLGNLLEGHMASAPQREAQERVAKATEEGKNQPIVKKPNGKFVAGCLKCQGSGVIPRFGNTADGMCFDCKGAGFSNRSQEHDSAEGLRKLMVDTRVARAQGMPVRNTTSTPAVAAPAPSERPKGFTNKFPGNCVGCGNRVGKGEGMTSKGPSDNWEVRCVGCHHG